MFDILNHPDLMEKGVHLIADFSGRTGLSQSARDVATCFRHLGCPVQVLDLPLSPERMPETFRFSVNDYGYQTPKSPLTIIAWNGDVYPLLAQLLPAEIFKNRTIVGIWYWETDYDLPDIHKKGYGWVDEVWVTTRFIQKSLQRSAPVPIKLFHHLAPRPILSQFGNLFEIIGPDQFVYLFCFDWRSVAKRKNPEAVCEAFCRAFPEVQGSTGALCVIKSIHGRDSHFYFDFLLLKVKYLDRPDIIFIDEWMTPEERDALMARANCYVSLHRSEGLGLTIMESMVLGRPCIATNYSGNLEFMNPENSWLVDFQIKKIGKGVPPYPEDHLWAEPDIASASMAMREVYDNPLEAAHRAQLGQDYIAENFGIEKVSAQLGELASQALVQHKNGHLTQSRISDDALIEADMLQLEDPESLSLSLNPTVSQRTQAYQILKEVRMLEELAKNQKTTLSKRSSTAELLSHIGVLRKIVSLQTRAHQKTLGEVGDLKKKLLLALPLDAPEMLARLDRENQSLRQLISHMVPGESRYHTEKNKNQTPLKNNHVQDNQKIELFDTKA